MEVHSVRELAAVVRSLRREKGWTQGTLAREAGVGREWVIHLEKARPRVEFGLVMATLKALGVRLNIEPHTPVETEIDLGKHLDGIQPDPSNGHE
jgi:HTH-type transcriptional regulator / antitoxin HipB